MHDPEGSAGEPAAAAHGDGADRGARTATIEAGDFWASGDTQEFVGVAPAAAGESARSRAARLTGVRQRVARAQVLVAVVAAMLIVVAAVTAWRASSAPVRVAKTSIGSSAQRHHGHSAGTYASASSRPETGSYAAELGRLHRPVLPTRPKARANKATRPRTKPVHRATTAPQVVQVSYEQAAPATSSASTSSGSSSASSNPPQHSMAATTASASGGVGSSSSPSPPPQPGPSGALTCISNCG